MLNKERPEVIEALIECFTDREDAYRYTHVPLEKFRDKMNIKQEFKKPLATQIQEWLYTEYIESFKITQAEKCILESIDKKYLWIVRDLSEGIGLYEAKPEKEGKFYHPSVGSYTDMRLFKHLFSWLTFENSPLKIGDILDNCEVIDNVK